MGCQRGQRFGRRHRRAACTTRQNHRLHGLGQRQLGPQGCRRSLERTDARDHVVVYLGRIQERHLLLDGAVDARIARLQTNYLLSAPRGGDHHLGRFFQRHRRRVVQPSRWPSSTYDLFAHQRSGVHDEIGLA